MTSRRKAAKPEQPSDSPADLLATGFELQHLGLDLLHAEMLALAALMPGEDTRRPTDAEIEAGFDNMPI